MMNTGWIKPYPAGLFAAGIIVILLCTQVTMAAEPRKATVNFVSLSSVLINGKYHLNAEMGLVLSEEMIEAMDNGVPLIYLLSMKVLKPRLIWFHQIIELQQQRYELRYHALSRQYLVTNLNSGQQSSFFTLASALDGLGDIEQLPLLNKSLMDKDKHYFAEVKFKLDVERLPVPLKVRAYAKKAWRVKTRWVRWQL